MSCNRQIEAIVSSEANVLGQEVLSDWLDEVGGEKDLDIIRMYHQHLFNRLSPAGGFESLAMGVPSFGIYFPHLYKVSLSWHRDLITGRSLLKDLIRLRDPKLFEIPHQHGASLGHKVRTLRVKLAQRFSRHLRTWGLDYENWTAWPFARRVFQKILDRPNPIFESLWSQDGISYREILTVHPHVSLDIIKVKLLCDLIVFDEFGEVFRDLETSIDRMPHLDRDWWIDTHGMAS